MRQRAGQRLLRLLFPCPLLFALPRGFMRLLVHPKIRSAALQPALVASCMWLVHPGSTGHNTR